VSLYVVLPVCFIQCRSIVSRPSLNFIASSYSQQAHHYFIHVIFSPTWSSSSVPSSYSLQPSSWLLRPFAFLFMHFQDSLSWLFFFHRWSSLCHGFFPYEECLIRFWVGLSLVVGFTPYLLSCSITLFDFYVTGFSHFSFLCYGFIQIFSSDR
jgi:hypothetical protein